MNTLRLYKVLFRSNIKEIAIDKYDGNTTEDNCKN